MEAKVVFQKAVRKLGVLSAVECFEEMLEMVKEEMYHDGMGCDECQAEGRFVPCPKSSYHPDHPFHVCSPLYACECQ
jgi:hypothetical protein